MADDGYRIETYKSLIVISSNVIRSIFLLNGGAAIAVLALVGNAWGKTPPIPSMIGPISWFAVGLGLSVFAGICSYLTQLTLWDCLNSRKLVPEGVWMGLGFASVIFGLDAFAIGITNSVYIFQQ